MEIGTDIELVDRFKLPREHSLIQKLFTYQEQEYAYSKSLPEIHLCGFFCAKEAFFKATQTTLLHKEVSVGHKKTGQPVLYSHDQTLPQKVSIAHTKKYATAVVIHENGEKITTTKESEDKNGK